MDNELYPNEFTSNIFEIELSFEIAILPKTKDISLTIVTKDNPFTCNLIWLKGGEHVLLSGHMIGASTIKHPLWPTGGIDLQNMIKPSF